MSATDQELEDCRVALAKRLGLEELPDAVWRYIVEPGLVSDAITKGKYQKLEKEARWRLRKCVRSCRRFIVSLREAIAPSSRRSPGKDK